MLSISAPGLMSFSQSEYGQSEGGGVGSVPPLLVGVKVNVAGVGSMLPAASLAHTLKVYVVPTVRLVYIRLWVEVQSVRVESRPINLHWNVVPSSSGSSVNVNVTEVPITLPLGGLVMIVSGGVVSVPPSEAEYVTTSRIALCPVPVPPALTSIVV